MPNVLVAEDDRFLRVVQVVLDPDVSAERVAAYTDFFAHDEPDFAGWCAKVRAKASTLYPAQVRLVETQEDLQANLADARALIVEGLSVGAAEIAAAPHLRAVQKYGVDLRRIDTEACAAKGIAVLSLRRRANIACAELAFTLMLMLARRVNELAGRISVEALAELGYHYQPYDRRHTPNSNWGRVPGLKILYGTTVGIIGLGEIGREFALRAAAFGMRDPLHAAPTGAGGHRTAIPGDLSPDGGLARAERLGRAAGAGLAGDGEPDRPRRTCAHAAGRAAGQHFARRRGRSRGADRGAAVRPSRRLRARSTLRVARPR